MKNKGIFLLNSIKHKNVYAVKILLTQKADPNSQDFKWNNGLHILFREFKSKRIKSIAIARMLIENGINTHQYNSDGFCPIHIAWISEQNEAIKFMIFANDHYKRQIFDLDIKGIYLYE